MAPPQHERVKRTQRIRVNRERDKEASPPLSPPVPTLLEGARKNTVIGEESELVREREGWGGMGRERGRIGTRGREGWGAEGAGGKR